MNNTENRNVRSARSGPVAKFSRVPDVAVG